MPLAGIETGKARRCTALAKRTKDRCRNPAAWTCRTCRMHGARQSIKRGQNHPCYRHGDESLQAKAERSRRLVELRELEALSFSLGFATGPRWRGRKPKQG